MSVGKLAKYRVASQFCLVVDIANRKMYTALIVSPMKEKMELEVIEPHGLCAGVNAAVAKARRLRDVYCLHELVHNEMIVEELRGLGYRFVDRIEDVPDGATVVFSAHGVPPNVRGYAAEHGMKVVDATCPFVERVHRAAREFAERGLPVVVIGDPMHAEVRGIAGEVLDAGGRVLDYSSLISGGGGATRIGVVAQTSMNSDEVELRVAELRSRFDVVAMSDVCRATKERQDAVRMFCRRNAAESAEGRVAVLVLGSRMSANSRRLVEVANRCGARAFMAGAMDELRAIGMSGVERLGVTSGASTPEGFFSEAMRFMREHRRGGET